MYKDVEGRSVKLEALGNIDKDICPNIRFYLASHEKGGPRGTK